MARCTGTTAGRTESLDAKAPEQHHRERSEFRRHVELYLRPLTSLARGLARRASTVMRVGRARLVGPDTASHRVVDALRARPNWIPRDGIELGFRLGTALRTATDADGGNRWLHHRWRRLFDEMFDVVGDELSPRTGFHALCLGAGSRNPLAFPLLLYAGGAARVSVVEPEIGTAMPDWQLGWGLQEMVLRLLSGDVTSRHFVRSPDAAGGFVDLRRLFFGTDVRAALNADVVRLYAAYLEDCPIAPNSVDLVTSRSVLEHITEIERCFSAFGTIVRPGGLMCHHVDLSAHDADDPFAFYYAPDVGTGRRRADDLNGLRLSDYEAGFAAHGFETEVVTRTILHDYPLARHRLTPRFRHYAEDDLRCRRAVIVARKRRATGG